MIRDTTPEAARVRWIALSRMSGQQRLRQALELTDLVLSIHADGNALEESAASARAQSNHAHHSGRALSAESTLELAVETLCDEGAVSEAVSLKGMFSDVDPTTGWKIDFIVLKPTPFGRAAFDGMATAELGGVPPKAPGATCGYPLL